MRFTKLIAGVGLAGTIALAATPAFAHECYVANRSDQGNAAVAAHSAAWFPLTSEIIFGEIFGLSGDSLTCAVDAWSAAGYPDVIVVGGKQAVGQDAVIMDRNPNLELLAADGHGIDHAEEVYGAAAFEIAMSCSA